MPPSIDCRDSIKTADRAEQFYLRELSARLQSVKYDMNSKARLILQYVDEEKISRDRGVQLLKELREEYFNRLKSMWEEYSKSGKTAKNIARRVIKECVHKARSSHSLSAEQIAQLLEMVNESDQKEKYAGKHGLA